MPDVKLRCEIYPAEGAGTTAKWKNILEQINTYAMISLSMKQKELNFDIGPFVFSFLI